MAALLFAIGTYIAAFLCLWFCYTEGGTWFKRIVYALTLIGFMFLFYLLESWAGIRAPFYEYEVTGGFPWYIPKFDFSPFAGFSSLLQPSVLATTHPCSNMTNYMPLAIPVAGGCIVFTLLWTVRLLYNSEGFATMPFNPVTAPFLVGLMALWMDLPLDPILAESQSCIPPVESIHGGLRFWLWSSDASLADIWFHVPLYNFATWYAAPAILTAVIIWLTWLYLWITGAVVQFQDGALRSVILGLLLVIFIVSPNSAASIATIYTIVIVLVAIGVYYLITKYETFKRNNEWRIPLVATLTFFFIFPLLAFLFTGAFSLRDIYLFLIALFVAVWGIVFATLPYWKLTNPIVGVTPLILGIILVVLILGYLGNT